MMSFKDVVPGSFFCLVKEFFHFFDNSFSFLVAFEGNLNFLTYCYEINQAEKSNYSR